jgi:WD40 repeat protein
VDEARPFIEIRDVSDRRRIWLWRGHSAAVKSLAFSPDGQAVGSGGDDAAIRVESGTSRNRTTC